MIERFNEPNKEGLEKYFDLCFDNLIKIYASHHYYITQAI
jgi:hypothetical protein